MLGDNSSAMAAGGRALLLLLGLLLALSGHAASRSMMRQPAPPSDQTAADGTAASDDMDALDEGVAAACAEPVEVKPCVDARLARAQAFKRAGNLSAALSDMKACRDIDPKQFGALAKSGPGRDFRMLGLAVSKITEGDKQLALAADSDKTGDRENTRVLYQQAASTLGSALRDIRSLRLGSSQPILELLQELQAKIT